MFNRTSVPACAAVRFPMIVDTPHHADTPKSTCPEGHADERQGKAESAALPRATVDAIGAPAESVRILLSELPAANLSALAARRRRQALPVIIAILIAGRTGAQKEALIAHLSETSASILESTARRHARDDQGNPQH